jgi:uncharacterized 2Fe-2S/4Fe-4S cluster protein (DUF4445 family)
MQSAQTIGGGRARGICGSGVIDAVSELLRCGIIDRTGRMASTIDDPLLNERLSEENGVRQFLLERDSSSPIVFTQKDVREVQLAKAAVYAGFRLLLKETGLGCKDIDKVYITGGFGNYMDMESALNIGLIPDELRGKTLSVGNAAGTGAKLFLLSKAYRQKTAGIINLVSYIELSDRSDFQEFFVDVMTFE